MHPTSQSSYGSVDSVARLAAPLWAIGWIFQTAWLVLFAQEALGLCQITLVGATVAFQVGLSQYKCMCVYFSRQPRDVTEFTARKSRHGFSLVDKGHVPMYTC